MDFKRYAIYYTPEGALAEFGTGWLGWNIATGQDVPHPVLDNLPLPISEITEAPRKYGLHATLKPPFRLAEGQEYGGLEAAFDRFCATTAPVRLDGLDLVPLGRFLALVARGDMTRLNALAADVVRGFDRFRAPPDKAELAKRRTGGLTPRQDAMLLQWGYPHVMETFRFHITLTGKLPKPDLSETRKVLGTALAGLDLAPFTIGTLALCGEDQHGRFHVTRQKTLAG